MKCGHVGYKDDGSGCGKCAPCNVDGPCTTTAWLQGVRILDFACDTAMDSAEEPLAVWSSIQVLWATVKGSV